jgi:peptidoglycan hydrolase CwlO-like protein
MSNKLEQLTQQRDELTQKAEDLQIKSAEHQFEINLDSRSDVKTMTEHLNKDYTWKTQNAAVIVTLYDRLKEQYKQFVDADESVTIKLRGHELNGLYQALLNVEGTGIENARRFIKMLTNVGEAVTNAMKDLSEMNQEINDIHGELSELDQEIDTLEKADSAEEVEPELEAVKDEASK